MCAVRSAPAVLRQRLHRFVCGKSVLELGCGEGHLTQAVFSQARAVTGIDISEVAIRRASALHLCNARFENRDFLRTSFEGYDVIAAIECLYYLLPNEQEEFFAKVAREHERKLLIISGPIIGENQHRKYFTHAGLLETFGQHGLSVVEWRNLYVNRIGALRTIAAVLVRLPGCLWLIDWIPKSLVYQRCYVVRSI
jgi:predicted TPR repeat methyltransferase